MAQEEELPFLEESQEDRKIFSLLAPKYIFAFLLLISLAIGFQWMARSETLSVPDDIHQSRREFFKAKSAYDKKPTYWIAKAKQYRSLFVELSSGNQHQEVIDTLIDVSPEVFVALLWEYDLMSPLEQTKGSIMPKKGVTSLPVIISKHEKEAWPLHVIVSLEAEFKVSRDHFSIEFIRLRRGAKDLSLSLCTSYFGPELESFQKLNFCEIPALGMVHQ